MQTDSSVRHRRAPAAYSDNIEHRTPNCGASRLAEAMVLRVDM